MREISLCLKCYRVIHEDIKLKQNKRGRVALKKDGLVSRNRRGNIQNRGDKEKLRNGEHKFLIIKGKQMNQCCHG